MTKSGSRLGPRRPLPACCRLSGLILGYPLDHLLDQSVDLNSPDDRRPGIKLPSGERPGTGNIVICGPPGSGKSTLGLQIAVACAKGEENGVVSAYISLESTIGEIREKARDYGWFVPSEKPHEKQVAESSEKQVEPEVWLLEAGHLSDADQFLTPQEHARNLLAVLTSPPDTTSRELTDSTPSPVPGHEAKPLIVRPKVLLSTLTPRDISGSGDEAEDVFWRRYRQLESLLMAARELEELRADDTEATVSRLALAAIELARDVIRATKRPSSSAAEAESDKQVRARLTEAAREWLRRTQNPPATETANVIETASTSKTTTETPEAVAKRVRRLANLARDLTNPFAALGADTTKADDRLRRILLSMAPLINAAGKTLPHEAAPNQTVPEAFRIALARVETEVELAAQKVVARCEARAILPLVVIDSLNMFGPASLSRNHVYQLFQLFKRYDRIGVFIVETGDEIFDSTLADVVIRLSATKDNGYAVRHIEIEKSRYSNCVRGLHPFKSVMWVKSGLTPPLPDRFPRRPTTDQLEPARCGIVIFPSLHHVVLKTDSKRGRTELSSEGPVEFHKCFGLPGIETVLQGLYRSQTINDPKGTPYIRGKVVMFRGARGTFKKNLALSFLADGLTKNESVMLIRLSDVPMVVLKTERHHGEESPLLSLGLAGQFRWSELEGADPKEYWQHIAPPSKILVRKLARRRTVRGPKAPAFFEVDFKSGHVLPEELVQFVSDVLIRCGGQGGDRDTPAKIRRVVLSDVGQIGVSYPFLRNSLTSGDLFLPAFVHLMRNYGVDLVMVGTTSGVPEADAAVDKAATLADAVVSCRVVDVFGASQVVLSGDQAGRPEDSTVLPVLRRIKTKYTPPPKTAAVHRAAPDARTLQNDTTSADGRVAKSQLVDCFELDEHYLDGLVGVETGNPHRPGLILQIFADDAPQIEYNREMEVMLRAALARPKRLQGGDGALDSSGEGEASDVFMQSFNSAESEAIHDSLDILKNNPVNRTVLCTVDEFSKDEADVFVPLLEEGTKSRGGLSRKGLSYPLKGAVYAWPYYRNLLLVAYRQDWFEERCAKGGIDGGEASRGVWHPKSWQSVWNALSSSGPSAGLSRVFWHDRKARETLACVLMDALIAARNGSRSDQANREAVLASLLLRPPESQLSEAEIDELVALSRLLGSSRDAVYAAGVEGSTKTGGRHTASHGQQEDSSGPRPLTADGMVYVCWYSQLRELIDRVPKLAGNLRVCALPGGGFQGDWYVGILRGSVSPELGREVIAKLCRRDEEYKRFALGVGLPVSRDFAKRSNNYFAWPGAVDAESRGVTVPAWRVFDIHKAAWSRSRIQGYRRIRSNLSKIGEQLGAIDSVAAVDENLARLFVQEVAGARMFSQIAMLAKDPPKPAS